MPAPLATPPPALNRRLLVLTLIALGLLGMAFAWRFSPASEWLEPMRLIGAARQQLHDIGWAGVLLLFTLACALAVPLSLLVLLAVLAFGGLQGVLMALAGGSLTGIITFGLGRWLGRDAVAQWLERYQGSKLKAIHGLVERRGLLAVIAVRLVPAAPFAVVNLLLALTPVRWSHFLLGNVLGMTPMCLATAWLAPQILAQLQHPTGFGLALVLGLLAALGTGSWALQRWAAKL
jgi:uncharacterized membrane protein YdjX (TVP38/TMEM64 family)